MEYPYYVIPDIEALPEATGEERRRLVRRIAALVGDPMTLRQILNLDPEEFQSFYPDMVPPDLDTVETIDTFIDRYADKTAPSHIEESATAQEIVPLPPTDYDLNEIESAPLITDDDPQEGEDATAALLNSFLPGDNAKTASPEATNEAQEEDGETLRKRSDTPQLSESLARAMIKNGNYSKALEIITDLSLKNPKKSIYFADQIRFLKKLILNQSKGNPT